MEKKKSIKKIVAIIVGIVIILAAIFYFAFYSPVRKYIDTHTWATIRIVEEVNAETSDVFVDSKEYSKGDTVSLDSVTLLIEEITHDGVVTISGSEEVTDSRTGEAVSSFTINCGESCSFKEKNGSVTIFVDSSRYE
ncbi:MAG: hypothetical protein PUC55_00345 [Lachnospiraceae bacterium]|nr:hypothetical protein [Lachnospiraceae bacterium]